MSYFIFIGGSKEAYPAVEEALKLGFRILVVDKDKDCACRTLSDIFINKSVFATPSVLDELEKIRELEFGGVLCVATDAPGTVAAIVEKYSLIGPSLETAVLTEDKIAMKECFSKHSLPTPEYLPIKTFDQLLEFLSLHKNLVIKPSDNRGARGIFRINIEDDLEYLRNLYIKSKNFSSVGMVLAEEYLSGDQLSSESLVINGKAFTIGLSDRNYSRLEEFYPNIIEDGGDLPTKFPEDIQKEANELIQKITKAIGLVNGVIKGDLVLNKGELKVIEVASRLSGGYFCTHEIPLSTGINFVKYAIKIAAGLPIEMDQLKLPSNKNFISQRYFFSQPGQITELSYPEKESVKGLEFLDIKYGVGHVISKIESHPSRLGLVICSGENRNDAIDNATQAVSSLKISLKK